jgi:hypothetical protein
MHDSRLSPLTQLINNGDFLSQHGTVIMHRAARLALEVHARVPVLPRSMVCSGLLPWHSIMDNYFILVSGHVFMIGQYAACNNVLSKVFVHASVHGENPGPQLRH